MSLVIDVLSADCSREVVENFDVIITATNFDTPVFDGEHLQDGTDVTVIGQYHPDKRGLDTSATKQAKYAPGLVERAHQGTGSFLIPKRAGTEIEDSIHTELGKIVCGRIPSRVNDSEITIFDSGRIAIETVAAAYTVYKNAIDRGIRTQLEFKPSGRAQGAAMSRYQPEILPIPYTPDRSR